MCLYVWARARTSVYTRGLQSVSGYAWLALCVFFRVSLSVNVIDPNGTNSLTIAKIVDPRPSPLLWDFSGPCGVFYMHMYTPSVKSLVCNPAADLWSWRGAEPHQRRPSDHPQKAPERESCGTRGPLSGGTEHEGNKAASPFYSRFFPLKPQ